MVLIELKKEVKTKRGRKSPFETTRTILESVCNEHLSSLEVEAFIFIASWRKKRDCSISDIAKHLHCHQSTANTLIRVLAQTGVIKREKYKGIVYLSSYGNEVVDRILSQL